MAAYYQIDSCILRSMLDDQDREKNRKTAKHILNSKKYGNLGVSIFAIGEVLGKMAQDREIDTCLVAITELRRMIREGVLFLRGFGPDEIAFGICMEIMAADQMITPGDALIVASALADPGCHGLLTTDEEVLTSKAVRRIMAEHGMRTVDPRVLVGGSIHSRQTADFSIPPETYTMPLPPSPQHV